MSASVTTITSVSPNPASPGQDIVITGTNLGAATYVVFQTAQGAQRVRVIATTATSVRVNVPVNARVGLFYVITPNGNAVGPVLSVTNPLGPANPSAAGATAAAAFNAAQAAAQQAAQQAYNQAGGARGGPAAQAAANAAAQAAAQQAASAAGDPSVANAAARSGASQATAPPQSIWNRIASNPYAQSILQPLSQFLGPGALLTSLASVRQSRQAGEQIASDLVRGALSVPRAALDAGMRIGQTVLDGVLSLFGPSGAAVSRFVGQVGGFLSRALDAGIGLASRGAKLLGGVIGAGAGVVGGIGGAAIGAMFGFPGALVGAAIGAGIVAGIMKAVEGLASAVAGVLEGVSRAFGAVAEVVSGLIQTIMDVVKDAVDTSMRKARDILQLSQATGWSLGVSAMATQNAQAFGIGANQVSRQNAFVAGSLASLYGGDGSGSADDLRSYRAFYRQYADQGPLGLMMAQIYEGATGKEGYREAVNYDDDLFEQQLARSSMLGMDPESVRRFGEEFKSVLDTIAMLAENVKVKIAEAFLPLLQEGLDAAIEYWMSNQDKIVETIFTVGRWFYATLPTLMLKGLDLLMGGLSGFMSWMSGTAHSMADILRAFQGGDGGSFVEGIVSSLVVFDYITVGLKGLFTLLAHLGGVFYDLYLVIKNVAVGLENVVIFTGKMLDKVLAMIPSGALATIPGIGPVLEAVKATSRWAAQTDYSAFDTNFAHYNDVQAGVDRFRTTDFAGMVENMRSDPRTGHTADALDHAADALSRGAQTVNEARTQVEQWGADHIGTEEERGRQFDEQTGLLREIRDSNRQIADNSRPRPQSFGAGQLDGLLARFAAYLTEDSYLEGSR